MKEKCLKQIERGGWWDVSNDCASYTIAHNNGPYEHQHYFWREAYRQFAAKYPQCPPNEGEEENGND